MNKIFCFVPLLFSLLFIQGCTNKLYQADISVLNSDDQEREVVLYWTKTVPLIGEDKSTPVTVLTECSSRTLLFLEKECGIYFLGEPGQDKLLNQTLEPTPNIQCGKIVNEKVLNNIEAGELAIEINCTATSSNEFAVINSSYIKAQNTPYTFDIVETSSWSFFGEIPDAPSRPKCREFSASSPNKE